VHIAVALERVKPSLEVALLRIGFHGRDVVGLSFVGRLYVKYRYRDVRVCLGLVDACNSIARWTRY